MEALVLGRLGMTPAQVLEMTPRELQNAIRGYYEQMDERMRDEWERARLIAFYAIRPHLKGSKGMEQLLPLPWDKKK